MKFLPCIVTCFLLVKTRSVNTTQVSATYNLCCSVQNDRIQLLHP